MAELSLEMYFSELRKQRLLLEVHCREIQLAIKRLENRLLKEELRKQENASNKKDDIAEVDISEIDELIKKAQKVMVNDPDDSMLSKQTGSTSVKKRRGEVPKPVSTKLKSAPVVGPSRTKSSLHRIDSRKMDMKTKNGVRCTPAVNTTTNTEIKQGIVPKNVPPMFDASFKEEYSKTYKIQKRLTKLKLECSNSRANEEASSEFMSNLLSSQKHFDIKQEFNVLESLSTCMAEEMVEEQIKGILVHIHNMRDTADEVINRYNGEHVIRLNKFPISHNSSIDTSHEVFRNTLRDFCSYHHNLYKDAFLRECRPIVEKLIHQSEKDLPEKKRIQLYRQAYSLLSGKETFPVLVHDPDE